MKLHKGDNVLVITGKDKGKTGEVLQVIPSAGRVVVQNINVVKRHTKPSSKNPRGGILEITKPIDVSKVMVIDPITSQPSRVSYRLNKDGSKERDFKATRRAKVKTEKAKK
jgi:large subunit ribosomal protein L24